MSLFGICLGMQLLLTEGEENGISKGLNFIEGKVNKLTKKKGIKLPIVGWGKVNFSKKKEYSFLSKYQNNKFYFIHSYVANLKNKKNELANSSYNGISYTSAVIKNNCIGTQFHPEKSGEVGLEFLKDWIKRL